MIKKLPFHLVLLCAVLVLSCQQEPKDTAVVATVNGNPIYLTDLQKDVRLHDRRYDTTTTTPQTLEDQLKTMIDRKLMLEQAQKLKLDRTDSFEETIRSYREQTLIRDLIKAKNREWENTISAIDEEVEREYKRMGYRAVIRATRVPDRKAAEDLARKIKEGKNISCDMVGPCYYDEVRLTPLGAAFDMNVGDIRIEPVDDEFIVILVEHKQKVALPPLKTMRPQLVRLITEQKQQKALTDWLESVRQSASITVDKKLISAAAGTR